jgi:aminobutyraldehyde dehydrogenase
MAQASNIEFSSGYGKDMSMYALEDYTVTRHVMVKY